MAVELTVDGHAVVVENDRADLLTVLRDQCGITSVKDGQKLFSPPMPPCLVPIWTKPLFTTHRRAAPPASGNLHAGYA